MSTKFLFAVIGITLACGIFIGGNLQKIDRRVTTALAGMPLASATSKETETIVPIPATEASTTVVESPDVATSSIDQANATSTTVLIASSTPSTATSTAAAPKLTQNATSTQPAGNAQIPPHASTSVRTVSVPAPWMAYPAITIQ